MASITFTYPAADATRYANCIGDLMGLKDNQTPPQPRAATATEVKQYFIGYFKRLLIDYEGAKLNKIALDAVVVPSIDIT